MVPACKITRGDASVSRVAACIVWLRVRLHLWSQGPRLPLDHVQPLQAIQHWFVRIEPFI